MTAAPGRSLSAMLRGWNRVEEPLFNSAAAAVIRALDLYWSREDRLYGDIHLRNILCDPDQRVLSFVDPGMPEKTWTCADVSGHWQPASRDLAYMLHYTASAVKLTLNKPILRRRERWLVTQIVREGLIWLASEEDREQLLEEIRACAASHLSRLKMSRSPSGLWRLLVKRLTARYVGQVLDELERTAVDRAPTSLSITQEAHA
jgi:hypothetical protein